MSDIPPSEQGKIPGTNNNGPFVVIALLLGVVLVGLLVIKFKGSGEESKTVATAEPPKPTAAPKPVLTDSVPPPPEEEPEEEKPDGGAPRKAGSGGGPCSGTCSGSLTSAASGDLRGLSGVARGCYERALRTNSMLQGKMTVAVRLDPSGSVCSASVSGDTLGAPDVTACVLSAFRGKRVAAPTGGCADSTMTLNFQAKDKLS